MPKPAKFRNIAEQMKRDLERAEFKPGETFYSEHAACERYGASRSTIRKAMGELEEEGLLNRVQGLGAIVQPHTGNQSHLICFISHNVVEYQVETLMMRGIESQLHDCNGSLLIINTNNDIERTLRSIRRAISRGVEGFAFLPFEMNAPYNRMIIDEIQGRNLPMVLLDRNLPPDSGLTCITPDNVEGGRLATRHLIQLGHDDICFYHTLELDVSPPTRNRFEGYAEVMRAAGLEVRHFLCDARQPLDVHRLESWFLGPDRPTAIVADHDRSLTSLYQLAHKHGLQVPGDLSIVGFNDLQYTSEMIQHTTIRLPLVQLGQMGAMKLISYLEDAPQEQELIRLPVELIIRNTTGINPRLTRSGRALNPQGTASR